MADQAILMGQQDGSALPNAPTSKYWVFHNTDGTWRKKDDAGVITDMVDEADNMTHVVHGSVNNLNFTNSYLRMGGNAFSNLSPFILPFNSTIIGISAGTQVTETWTAEVHSGLSLITGATLSISAATSGSTNSLSIDMNLGDPIELFVNGTNIQRPNIAVFFVRR